MAKLKAWIQDNKSLLLLLLAILLPLPALLTGLGKADATRHMEVVTLFTSQETWLRQHQGEEDAWLNPTYNGKLRIRKPPGSVWLNLIAWTGLTPEDSEPVDLIHRARLLGVALSLFLLAAVFWIGQQLYGPFPGFAAALAVGLTHAFLDQARMASYDTHLMAWCALALAAGFRAIDKEERSFFFAGLAGVFAAAAFLCKGPVSLVFTLLPIFATILVLKEKREVVLKTVATTAIIAILLVLPWYIYLLMNASEAIATLLAEYQAARTDFQPPWYYLGLVAMVLPWSLWLLAGIGAPFQSGPKERKQRLLIPLVWFVAIFIVLSIPAAKQQRYIVPILPAAGLLIANVWFSLDPENRNYKLLTNLHWTLLLVASLLLPVFMVLQDHLLIEGVIDKLDFPGVGICAALSIGVALLATTLAGWILHKRNVRHWAFVATAAWMVLAFSFAYRYYVDSYHSIYEQKGYSLQVDREVGENTLYYLYEQPPPKLGPDQTFLLYTRRIVPPVLPEDLNRKDVMYVKTPRTGDHLQQMEAAGFQHVFDYHDGRMSRALFKKSLPK